MAPFQKRFLKVAKFIKSPFRFGLEPRWGFLPRLKPLEESTLTKQEMAKKVINSYNLALEIDGLKESALKSKKSGKQEILNFIATWIGILCFFAGIILFKLFNPSIDVGKAKPKFYEEYIPGKKSEEKLVKFDDVCGNDDTKEELMDIVNYLANPTLFKQMDAKVAKGILISGNPGCGKTLLAKALAGEAEVPFLQCSGSSFDEVFVGVGAQRVRKLFKRARSLAPCIIFIKDEIDAVGEKRSYAIVDHSKATLNQLLSEMDGFVKNNEIVVIGATNKPNVLDSALTRSGRFDRNVKVNLPDHITRQKMFTLFLKDKPVNRKINIKELASETAGFSGADINNIVNTAATEVVKEGRKEIDTKSIQEAISIIAMGRVRKNLGLSTEASRSTAYHEAGHTISALFGANPSKVAQVTILPRGPSLGATYHTQEEDSQFQVTRLELLARMDVMMGGFVAEEMVYGKEKVSSGAPDDFKKATEIASQMVLTYGLSPVLGKLSLGTNSLEHLPSALQREVNAEIKKMMEDSYKRTKSILEERKDAFYALSEELFKKNTLAREEILEVVNLPPTYKSSSE